MASGSQIGTRCAMVSLIFVLLTVATTGEVCVPALNYVVFFGLTCSVQIASAVGSHLSVGSMKENVCTGYISCGRE